MKAPNFTRENAAEMARRATVAREARRAREKAILREYAKNPPVDADDDARRKRVLKQIARCDSLLLSCEPKDFPRFTAAKERLWNLVLPKAGVLRPRKSDRSRMPEVRPSVEPVTPQAPPLTI
jgi:hypothetical protein